MKCVYCNAPDSKVIDSRAVDEDSSIKRRRECLVCGRRFTTFETIEYTPVFVIKNNGTRQSFDPQKIKTGIIKSTEKRHVTMAEIDDVVNAVTKQVYNSMREEITSKEIGEMVMEKLKNVDEVAYVRYASVYRSFKDLSTFMDELQKIMGK